MASGWYLLGDCTFQLTVPAGGSAVDFAGELKNVYITHAYEAVGEKRTMLDSTIRLPADERTDGVRADVENDLTAAGLYALLHNNDLAEADLVLTHVNSGASWTGSVILKLPADIGSDEYSNPIVSSIEWAAAGDTARFTFAAATAAP